MISGCGGDWTAVAVDKVLSFFFLKTSRAAQLFENVECNINSLLTRFAAQLGQVFIGHGSAGGPHSGAQISWLNMAGEYRHQKRYHSPVCFREKVFGFRAKSIRGVRFADAGLHA